MSNKRILVVIKTTGWHRK